MQRPEIGDDLAISEIVPRKGAGGKWVTGTLNGHYFQALVYSDHAECPDWELVQSRISKLWIQRLSDLKTVFNWDRGLDIPAADDFVQRIVDFLCEGLADFVQATSEETNPGDWSVNDCTADSPVVIQGKGEESK